MDLLLLGRALSQTSNQSVTRWLFWRSFTHLIGGMGVLVLHWQSCLKASHDTVHIMKAEVPVHLLKNYYQKSGILHDFICDLYFDDSYTNYYFNHLWYACL